MPKKKVLVIGGGNGSAIVLNALKRNTEEFDISAVISMSDSGGSSGRLRKEFKMLPPGDIMRAVLALSKYNYQILRMIFYQPRFKGLGKKLDGHNLGNLFLVLTGKYGGGFLRSLEALAQSVVALGRVYPVTLQPVELIAELTNGRIIRTEAFIDKPNYNRGFKIKRVWLEPHCRAYKGAVEAIKGADYIILSPGSLYTSIVAALLPKGIKEAIQAAKAKLIYIEGAYRVDGETGPESFSELIRQLEHYLPRPIGLVLHDGRKLSEKQQKFFEEKKWASFEFDRENLRGRNIKSFSYRGENGSLSSDKLSKILKRVLC